MEHPHEISAEVARPWDRPVVVVSVLACVALLGGQLPSFSTSANLYTIGVGGVLVWLGLSRRVPRRPMPQRLGAGALWWMLPIAIFGVFEAATFVAAAGDEFPTFSRLADPMLEDRLVRTAAWFAWLAAFWGLVRR